MNLLKLTFLDKDGSLAIPELVASAGAISGIGAFLWDCFGRGNHPDLAGFGTYIGLVVVALGSAQRIRDGIWKVEDK